MYRALAFKELRETAWIGALVFGPLLLVVLDQMGYFSFWRLLVLSGNQPPQPFSPHKIPFIHSNLQVGVALAAGAGAAVLGFWQMLSESVRGTWLFLLHRPMPRSHVVLTKLAAGGVLLLLATALPVLILALWAAVPGTHASPFVWAMTAQPFRLCFAATAVYLAACLCGLRPARWYGSRLLPLIPAVLVMTYVFITVWWPVTGWIVVAVVDVAYLAALLDAAVTITRPSSFSRMCTALFVALGFAVVYAIAAVWIGISFRSYFQNDAAADTRETLFVEPDGNVLIGAYDYRKSQYHYRSLDGRPATPKSERARLVGSLVWTRDNRPDVNQDGWAGCIYPFADNAPSPTYWYFVVADDSVNGRGYFAGYNAQTRLSVGYLARDGLTSVLPGRDAQFQIDGARFRYGGNLFGCLASAHSPVGLSPGGPVDTRADCTYPPWILYLFSGGRMLKIDLAGRTVGKALEADDILNIGQLFRTEPEGEYAYKNIQTLAVHRPESITLFNPIDESTKTWRIPAELRHEYFTFYLTTDQTVFVDVMHLSDPNWQNGHDLVWFNPAGEMTRREKLSLKGYRSKKSGFDAAGPFLVMPELLLWACVAPTIDADQPGSMPAFADIWPGVLFIILTTLISVVLADRKQRRLGLPRSYAWLAFVLLLGMPGYVGWHCHRRWPVRHPVAPPQKTGNEVFA